MIEDIKTSAADRMNKSVEAVGNEMKKLRTGRAHTSLLEHVTVEYYGNQVPINQVANVNVEDARTLAVAPWEKTMVAVVEKAILTSDLGASHSQTVWTRDSFAGSYHHRAFVVLREPFSCVQRDSVLFPLGPHAGKREDVDSLAAGPPVPS